MVAPDPLLGSAASIPASKLTDLYAKYRSYPNEMQNFQHTLQRHKTTYQTADDHLHRFPEEYSSSSEHSVTGHIEEQRDINSRERRNYQRHEDKGPLLNLITPGSRQERHRSLRELEFGIGELVEWRGEHVRRVDSRKRLREMQKEREEEERRVHVPGVVGGYAGTGMDWEREEREREREQAEETRRMIEGGCGGDGGDSPRIYPVYPSADPDPYSHVRDTMRKESLLVESDSGSRPGSGYSSLNYTPDLGPRNSSIHRVHKYGVTSTGRHSSSSGSSSQYTTTTGTSSSPSTSSAPRRMPQKGSAAWCDDLTNEFIRTGQQNEYKSGVSTRDRNDNSRRGYDDGSLLAGRSSGDRSWQSSSSLSSIPGAGSPTQSHYGYEDQYPYYQTKSKSPPSSSFNQSLSSDYLYSDPQSYLSSDSLRYASSTPTQRQHRVYTAAPSDTGTRLNRPRHDPTCYSHTDTDLQPNWPSCAVPDRDRDRDHTRHHTQNRQRNPLLEPTDRVGTATWDANNPEDVRRVSRIFHTPLPMPSPRPRHRDRF